MAKEQNPKQWALSLGFLFAILHGAWVVIVGAGAGQGIADWLNSIHFLNYGLTIMPFNLVTGLVGIVGALLSGLITGWLFATIWNWLGKQKWAK